MISETGFMKTLHSPGSEGGGSVLRAQYAGASKGRHTSPAGMVNP